MLSHDTDGDRSQPENSGGDRPVSQPAKLRVQVCQHTTCLKDGSAAVLKAFQAQQPADVEVVASRCMGNCGNGPTVRVLPDQQQYSRVRSQDLMTIATAHLDSDQHTLQAERKQGTQTSERERSQLIEIGTLAIAVLLIVVSLGWTIWSLT